MRVREIVGEALRNVASGTSRAVTLALALGAVLAALGIAEGRAVHDVVRGATEFRSVGGSTLILSADGGIAGPACDRLSEVDGISAAGAIRSHPQGLALAVLPSSPVPLWEATPGFGEVLGLDSGGSGREGVLVSDAVTERLGVVEGGRLWTAEGTAEVVGVYAYPADGRSPELEYAVVSPVPAGGAERFDQCWAEVWPTSSRTAQLLRLSLSASLPPDVTVTVSQLNSTLGADFDGAARFHDRVTRYAAIACLLLGVGAGYLSVRLRRVELASARHAGVTGGAQLLQIGCETAIWAGAASLLAAPLLWRYALAVPGEAWVEVLWLQLRCLFGGAAGAMVGALAGTVQTRERHLFRLFRER